MTRLRNPIGASDHSQGPSDAPLTLLEYGDYQCPYCGAAYPIIQRIQKEFGNELRFVFRNFPITSAHPFAMGAAIAAEAADLQSQFWPMHDLLFENQRQLEPENLVGYARSLNLDLGRFKSDLSLPNLAERVTSEQFGGLRSGVRGTPGLFINGERYDGDWSYPVLRNVLEDVRSRLPVAV